MYVAKYKLTGRRREATRDSYTPPPETTPHPTPPPIPQPNPHLPKHSYENHSNIKKAVVKEQIYILRTRNTHRRNEKPTNYVYRLPAPRNIANMEVSANRMSSGTASRIPGATEGHVVTSWDPELSRIRVRLAAGSTRAAADEWTTLYSSTCISAKGFVVVMPS